MTIQNISALPDAPTPADSPTEFATKAAAFVPALNPFGAELNQFGVDVVNEAIAVAEAAQDTVNITAQGMFNAIVVGDTDGINKEFDILNASFYPYFMLFQDGVKIPHDEITISGTTLTLTTAPTSGAKMEAIAPRSLDFIAPDGFKTIAFVSDKIGVINLVCDVRSGSVLPQWKVGGITTTSESFSYSNAGGYVVVYLYVPDDSASVIDAAGEDIFLIDVQYGSDSVTQIKLSYNSGISYYNSISNLTALESLRQLFSYNGVDSLPIIDTSNVVTFYQAFSFCNLTSFPIVDTSSVNNMHSAFQNNNLTSFPLIDTSKVTTFFLAWYNNDLESFPSLDYSSGTNFADAWSNNALTQTYVDQILIDLNNSNVSDSKIGLSGGTNATPSAAGLAAKSELESRGCTVYTN